MKQQIIVTIGREYGSGGHCIARQIADRLGIPLYDKESLNGMIAAGSGEEPAHESDEKPFRPFLSRRAGSDSNPLEENAARKVFDLLRARADAGESFVIVGRCGEYIFRSNRNAVRFFILGDREPKVQRIVSLYQLSSREALEQIRMQDKRRKLYHNYYSERKWGDSRGYDLCVNSSRLGIEKTAELLLRYIALFRAGT
jgi:cytidylate kinase